MSIYTASFRIHHRGHTFSREELALVERLERQRHITRCVRAVIDDPARKYLPVLQAYLSYIQHLDKRDCILVAPRSQNFWLSAELQRSSLRTLQVTPRSYLKLYGTRRSIGQLILLNADRYCPSIPLYRSRIDAILQIALPYINGANSVVIIHGSSKTEKNTRFRHWLKIASDPASIYLHLNEAKPHGTVASTPPHPAPKSAPLAIEHTFLPAPKSAPIISNSQFIILNLKIAA